MAVSIVTGCNTFQIPFYSCTMSYFNTFCQFQGMNGCNFILKWAFKMRSLQYCLPEGNCLMESLQERDHLPSISGRENIYQLYHTLFMHNDFRKCWALLSSSPLLLHIIWVPWGTSDIFLISLSFGAFIMYIGVLTLRYIAQFIIKLIIKEYHCSAVWRRHMPGAVVDNRVRVLSSGHIREATLLSVGISHNDSSPIIRVKRQQEDKDWNRDKLEGYIMTMAQTFKAEEREGFSLCVALSC